MRTVSSITSWSIVAGLTLAPACFGQDVSAEEDQEQAEEAEVFHEPAGPVTRDNWVPNAGDRTLEGEQLLGDLWTFRCPKGASVSISADTKDDTDEGEADIRPVLILLDGAGNIIASSGENDVNCTYTPVCGGACPVIREVECGSGEKHSIIVRDDGPSTTTDRLCQEGGGYTLTVEVVDAHGRQTVVDLGGGARRRVPSWALDAGAAPVGPALDDEAVPFRLHIVGSSPDDSLETK